MIKWLSVLLMFLIACSQTAEVQTEQPSENVVAEVSDGGVMDMAKAMSLGRPVKCVAEQSGQTVTIHMKGSQMRMDTMPADAHGIYTSDTMYTWQGSQGMMMKMEDVKKMASEQAQQFQPQTQEDVVENAKKYDARCESADVPESMFVPPVDVKFEDFGEMMRQIEQATRGLQK
jgi:hypothetical protein